jgi:hypothetical protein
LTVLSPGIHQVRLHPAHDDLITRNTGDREKIVLLPGFLPLGFVTLDDARNIVQQPGGVTFQRLYHQKTPLHGMFFTKNTQQIPHAALIQ